MVFKPYEYLLCFFFLLKVILVLSLFGLVLAVNPKGVKSLSGIENEEFENVKPYGQTSQVNDEVPHQTDEPTSISSNNNDSPLPLHVIKTLIGVGGEE